MASLLLELGAEELPPKALEGMARDFEARLLDALEQARLTFADSERFATPRRLAVLVRGVATAQADREVEKRGPPVKVAFDPDGRPTRAAEKFAESCGVGVDQLERIATPRGEWLTFRTREQGRPAAALVAEVLPEVVDGIAVPRRMRWGSGTHSFSRPVRWLVAMLDEQVIEGCEVLGCVAGRRTFGHRFHGPKEGISLEHAEEYPRAMERTAVVASFDDRRAQVRQAIEATAQEAGATALIDDELLDEVTALVELPVPVLASFNDQYLELPREVIIATLQDHQRYFPLADDAGSLRSQFITLANLRSAQPEEVRRGNERVVAPRLADAAFFWESDASQSLERRRESLEEVVFQRQLGTLADKTARVVALVAACCESVGVDATDALRAAQLAKTDLLTDMVGEFPELQGVMGGHYARRDGEGDAAVRAIAEQYLPRFAGDAIPATAAGRILGAADRIDTLAGYFAIGARPTGNKDPFGLRRSALGLLRILIEGCVEVDLHELLARALALQPVRPEEGTETVQRALEDFLYERLRGYYAADTVADEVAAEGAQSVVATAMPGVFEAVLAVRPSRPRDFDQRMRAVQAFAAMEEAMALAAANKRIANILRQAEDAPPADSLQDCLLVEPAERDLAQAVAALRSQVEDALDQGRYTDAMARLATLRTPVDRFFDEVMVMADDESVRRNRLALLASVQALFGRTADISLLQLG